MPTATIRKTGGRLELNGLWDLAKGLYTDVAGTAGVRAKVVALVTDVTALRGTVGALVTDVAAIRSHLATLSTKLNADSGVADTNYAAPSAVTSSAPAALTATNPDAITAPDTTLIGA